MIKDLDSKQTMTVVIILLSILLICQVVKLAWIAQCVEPVEAVFEEYEWKTGRNHQKEAVALYSYQYDEQSYQGHPLSTSFFLDKEPGISYTIYVNPSHPEYFTDILWYKNVFSIAGCAIPLLGIIIIVKNR